VRSARYQSIRENFGLEVDLVDRGHVILEMHHVIEHQPHSLAHKMVANDPLLCRYVAQMNILNMVPHTTVCETRLKARVRSMYGSCSFPMQMIHWVL
jgi:hypothetical protein